MWDGMDLNQSQRDDVFLSLTNLELFRFQTSFSTLSTGREFSFYC